MRLFFLFFLFCSQLVAHEEVSLAAVTAGEPSSFVAGSVSAITGAFFVADEDIQIQGLEPINFKRYYISHANQHPCGGWNFFNHIYLFATSQGTLFQTFNLRVTEPSGTQLHYYRPLLPQKEQKEWLKTREKYLEKLVESQKKKKAPPQLPPSFLLELEQTSYLAGLTNCSMGEMSARFNVQNQKVSVWYDLQQVVIYAPDGGERYYSYKHRTDGEMVYYIYLEKLSNGNLVHYEYDTHRRLNQIRTTNATGNKIYAWAKICYDGRGSEPSNFRIETSDQSTPIPRRYA